MTIPPWLNPPDYIASASRGFQLGLSMRQQEQAEELAQAKLSLEQDQIRMQQQRYAAQAAESLRAHNALEKYRIDSLKQRQQELDALNRYRTAALVSKQTKIEPGPIQTEDIGGGYRAVTRPGSPTIHVIKDQTASEKLSDIEKARIGSLNAAIAVRDRAIVDIEYGTDPTDKKAAAAALTRKGNIMIDRDRLMDERSRVLRDASERASKLRQPTTTTGLPSQPSGKKSLDMPTAKQFLQQAISELSSGGGQVTEDAIKARARELATAAGF